MSAGIGKQLRLESEWSGESSHARPGRASSANLYGVTGVAATRQFVALKFWVQLPGNSPISQWTSSSVARAEHSHCSGREFDSLLVYHF